MEWAHGTVKTFSDVEIQAAHATPDHIAARVEVEASFTTSAAGPEDGPPFYPSIRHRQPGQPAGHHQHTDKRAPGRLEYQRACSRGHCDQPRTTRFGEAGRQIAYAPSPSLFDR